MLAVSLSLDTTGTLGLIFDSVPISRGRSSLVTTLRAAEKFEKSHLSSPEVAPLIDGAKVFYVEGYFLTHGTESALEIAKKASETGKVRSPRL